MNVISKITWNPSEGIDLGFFELKFYSLMFVVAFSLGWVIIKKIYKNDNQSEDLLDPLFIYVVVATLLGARLGHYMFYDTHLWTEDPLSIFLPFSFVPEFEYTGFRGLASHGAAIAIPTALYFYSKKHLSHIKSAWMWIMDRIIIVVALGGVFIRLGNFINSEIEGKPTDSDLGVQFVRSDIGARQAVAETKIQDVDAAYTAIVEQPQFADLLASVPFKHPTQIYESLGYVAVFLILWFVYWKTDMKRKRGFLFGLFLVLLWSVRFIVEFLKLAQPGEATADTLNGIFGTAINTGQWLSIPFILWGLYLMFRPEPKQPA